jgi:hypothetical protein
MDSFTTVEISLSNLESHQLFKSSPVALESEVSDCSSVRDDGDVMIYLVNADSPVDGYGGYCVVA